MDGSITVIPQPVYVTLCMTTEIKAKLPAEGVRWLYLRTETKSVVNGRMDIVTTLFNESMELIAVSNQVAQLLSTTVKVAKL